MTPNATHKLSDDYTVHVELYDSHQVKIELSHNAHDIRRSVSLDNYQCTVLTNRLCETVEEFHVLLLQLLISTSKEYDCIRLVSEDTLEIIIRIEFLNQSKIQSFKIDLHANTPITESEITLDPTNWNETRLLGHQMMDDMLDYLRDVRLRPIWRPMPREVKTAFSENNYLPLEGQSPWQVYKELSSNILPYNVGNIHPCSWGYVQGTGSAIGALAELVAGTMNSPSWGGHQAGTHVELQVLSWLKHIMGFDEVKSSGVLVSGTSVATMVAIAVAKRKFHGEAMKVYCSTEAHNCLSRAVDMMGVGKENLIIIPTNEQKQIDLDVRVFIENTLHRFYFIQNL